MKQNKNDFFRTMKTLLNKKDRELNAKEKEKELMNEQLIQYMITHDEEFVDYVDIMIQKETFSIDLKKQALILLTENDQYMEYQSHLVKEIIEGSLEAWKEKKKQYEEMKEIYKQKEIEKYDQQVLETFKRDIEEKVRPSDMPEWIKKVTVNIVVDDIGAREFIRNNIQQIKGLQQYIEEVYPNKKDN